MCYENSDMKNKQLLIKLSDRTLTETQYPINMKKFHRLWIKNKI